MTRRRLDLPINQNAMKYNLLPRALQIGQLSAPKYNRYANRNVC
jgi:hypothetical protein